MQQAFFAGHFDEAVQQIHRTLEMDPTFGAGLFILGEIMEMKGQFPEAAKAYEKALIVLPTPMRYANIACVYVRLGRTAEAGVIRSRLADQSAKGYVAAYPRAVIALAFGETEEALGLLQQAFDDRSIQVGGNSGSLKIDPRLDALRKDPRFEKLLAKFMGQAQ